MDIKSKTRKYTAPLKENNPTMIPEQSFPIYFRYVTMDRLQSLKRYVEISKMPYAKTTKDIIYLLCWYILGSKAMFSKIQSIFSHIPSNDSVIATSTEEKTIQKTAATGIHDWSQKKYIIKISNEET